MSFPIDSPTVAAALIGAIVSAFLTNAVRSWIDRRAKLREAREILAEDAMTLLSEHSSNLLEFYISRRQGKSEEESLRADAVVRRSTGKLMQMQVRVWRLFPEWYVTKAMTKLIGRVNAVYQYIRNANANMLSDKDAEAALAWLYEQETSLLEHLCDSASIAMRSPEGIGFLGFNKETRQRRLNALKQDENDPPPWEPIFKLQFQGSEMSRELIESVESHHRNKLAKLRCKEHSRAAHVRIIGAPHNFNVQIDACCKQFATVVEVALKETISASQTQE